MTTMTQAESYVRTEAGKAEMEDPGLQMVDPDDCVEMLHCF